MAALIHYDILPKTFELEIKIYNFNKFLKKNCVSKTAYKLQGYPMDFFMQHFDNDLLDIEQDFGLIAIKDWEKIYKKSMDPIRAYLKENSNEVLKKLNTKIIKEQWDKDCLGSLSKWEMDSISFYSHPHELANTDDYVYNFEDFFELSEDPEIAYTIPGKNISLYKLHIIAGTVLDRDKAKKTVTLLTKTGVVTIKVWQSQFVKYDKQVSQVGIDGKKHVVEKSWFSRGNKIAVVGIRRGDLFIPKIYKNSGYEAPFMLITKILKDGTLEFKYNRGEES